MPIHDWTQVSSGTFHNFHYQWVAALANALNSGLLPEGYFAMAEQRAGGPIPDVLTLHLPPPPAGGGGSINGGLAVATAPPKASIVTRSEAVTYARRANRVTVRDELGKVVAVIEIVSPGNKESRNPLQQFVTKVGELLINGIHVVIVDVFPPTPRDPHGIHKAIWDDVANEAPFQLPKDKPLTAVSYCAEPDITGYVTPFAISDPIPEVPLFLTSDRYIPAPLDATYQAAWGVMPLPIRRLFDQPKK
jgi:hypothetical protein